MKWSLKRGKLLGIDLSGPFTFGLLLCFLGFSDWRATHDVQIALPGIVFILTLFGCVVLHELGHALMARCYGLRTRDITLLPIGGMVVTELLAGSQQDFPVMANEQPVGMLRRNELVKALSEGGREAVVQDCMSQDCETVEEEASLKSVVESMRLRPCFTISVMSHGRRASLLTLEHVDEIIMVNERSPVRGSSPPSPTHRSAKHDSRVGRPSSIFSH